MNGLLRFSWTILDLTHASWFLLDILAWPTGCAFLVYRLTEAFWLCVRMDYTCMLCAHEHHTWVPAPQSYQLCTPSKAIQTPQGCVLCTPWAGGAEALQA